ncbi:NUDIX domain-containing protein [Candidatus Uhrbacteria bacterium]|nr:NUDIX domain-containing protein [Candidatus Uhrbacteria bacterium]
MHTTHTVDILVTDGARRVLLVKRGKDPFRGKLVMPGGHIEPGETPEAAAVRELQEEAGIVVDPVKLHHLMDLDAGDRDPRGRYVSHVYAIGVPREVFESACAGSDAEAVVLRESSSLRREEMGFDHWDAILLLQD